jgi:O-succinylbenzoic acid--CoA ligase
VNNLRIVPVDGSPAAIAGLAAALRTSLDGGPAVLPRAPGSSATPSAAPGPGAALVIPTSGSTGDPKFVVLSAAALRASATATADRLGGPASWLLALPAVHVAGVQVIVRSLLAGSAPVLQDLRDGFRPADFAAATGELAAGRRCTSLVPTQLARVLDAGGAALEALRSYDAVLVGGAALEPALRSRARDVGARIVTTYGMSETAGGCVYDGVPLNGVRVGIDESGRIRLGGPILAEGYLGDPAGTAAVFGDGWFSTSDLGRWCDGRLEVLGRADDVIVTGGKNVAPAAVERVLVTQPGVRAACVVGLPDAEWGQVVAAAFVADAAGSGEPAAARLDRLRDAVRDELGRAAVPRLLRTVAEIPLRGVGKPDRRAVAALLAVEQVPGN